MPSPEKLTCLAIIICDDIYRDAKTQKSVIVGTFHTIHARSFPVQHPSMRILFTLTNGHGSYDLLVSLRRARDEAPLFEIKGEATLSNPLQITDIDIGVQNLVFPEAGKYWVSLEADGEPLASRPFMVEQIRDQRTQEPPS